mmetsp:Transcript_5060/g.6582  ORF Transcript_5060/g.6582 Transcript_5060/m.6582 type:complete len:235 (+) Transcript_5060:49-753(+)
MAAALPITKLAGLLIKTLSKPAAKRIKHDFSRYDFTKNILIGIGQTTHQLTSRMTIWSAGYKVRSITPLEPEKALTKGADLLGESIVFLISGVTVVYEYNRSKEKEKAKEAQKLKEIEDESDRLQGKLNALDARIHALEKVVKSNSLSLLRFGEKYVEPEVNVVIDDRQERRRLTASSGDEAAGLQTKNEGDAGATSSSSKNNCDTLTTNKEDEKISVDSSKPKSKQWRWWWPF